MADPNTHADHALVVKDTLVFLFAAGVVVPVLKQFRVPSVIGFVLAGLALGPFGLGTLAETWPVLAKLTITDTASAAIFAELGVLFLLFLLGLEFSFGKLWSLRRVVFGAGGLQSGLSALAIGGVLFAFGMDPVPAAIVGLALALSSTAIVMQFLIDERRAATPVGRTSLGVLLFQDILVAPILIFVGFAVGGDGQSLTATLLDALWKGVSALAVIILIGRYALRPVFRLAVHAGGRDFLMAITLLTLVGAAALTASAGLSLALGAFLAGLLLGETEFKHQTEVDLEPFKGLLLGLFFMTVGMALDLAVVAERWPLVLGGLAALLVVKVLLCALALRLFAGSWPLSVEASLLLAPAGEFAFVVFASAAALGGLDRETVAIGSAIVGLSMILIPVLGMIGPRLSGRMRKPVASHADLSEMSASEGHVIMIGYGRVGRAIAQILKAEGAEIIALERDPARIAKLREMGEPVYFGDGSRPEVLEKAGIHGASLLIVTVDDPAMAETMVRAARKVRAELPVLARARDADHARQLIDGGASFVIPDAIEAGLQLAGRALAEFGYEGETIRDRLALEREEAYELAGIRS